MSKVRLAGGLLPNLRKENNDNAIICTTFDKKKCFSVRL